MTRSLARLLPALAIATVLAAGCGEDDGGSAAPDTRTAQTSEPGAFPVTIEHKFGSTTVRKAPKRIVVAGLREQDSLLALGVVPVGTTEWYGEHPGAIFPWAEDALGDAPRPKVLSFEDGIQYEQIAALRPDLILAVYSGLTQKDYDTLSRIAPTVAQPPGQVDWGSSWQDEVLTVGRAIGKPREAERLRDEAEARLARREGRPARRRRAGLVRRPRASEEDPREPGLQPAEGPHRGPRRLPAGERHAVRGDVVHQRPQHPAAGRRARAQARGSGRRRPRDADRLSLRSRAGSRTASPRPGRGCAIR